MNLRPQEAVICPKLCLLLSDSKKSTEKNIDKAKSKIIRSYKNLNVLLDTDF